MNDFRNYTNKAAETIQASMELAAGYGHQVITPLHIMHSLIKQGEGVVSSLLNKMEHSPDRLATDIKTELEKLPKVSGSEGVYLSQEAQAALDRARKEAADLRDEYISTEHLFMGLLPDQTIGRLVNLDKQDVLKELATLRGNYRVTDPDPEGKFKVLEKYTQDLTRMAADGKIDPVIGRDEEIRRVMQIITRRTKNNPVLVGEPGTGKTAIVESLARKITDGDVPEMLKNRRLLAMDMGAMIAGTKYRGEFEDRFKALINEIEASNGEIVLFIDELHTIVGAGAVEGSMDAGNMLKPALARGKLHTIGATTLKEYRRYIEKDAALERRFQPVMVEEPSVKDAISILRGIKEKYELHHGVRIRDNAIVAAVNLSARYINDRFLPDKAIDLMDEATSGLKMELESKPAELDRLEKNIRQLNIEREALKKESDSESSKHLGAIEKELVKEQEKYKKIESQWNKEKKVIDTIKESKKRLGELKDAAERAEREGRLQEVAEIRYGAIPETENRMKKAQAELAAMQETARILKEEVTEEDIARVVSRWTGIPVTKMLIEESSRLTNMENELAKRLVGQKSAIKAVSNAVRRSRAGVQETGRPIGSFIFLGPTGVGKTELAKALAEFLFNDQKALIRIDMSEYMEKFSVSRLVGSPPGYVGHEEGGQLTENVRRHPFSVILFDEIEKAHPDVFNILLQMLDDGRLTDSKGRTVDFSNTVIIMTSNIASREIAEHEYDRTKQEDAVHRLLKQAFKPEFLNRIDDIIIFQHLTKAELAEIVELQVASVIRLLAEKGIRLELTREALDYLAGAGYDHAYGARPLKRVIQRELLDELAFRIVEGSITEGDEIDVRMDGTGKLTFEKMQTAPAG